MFTGLVQGLGEVLEVSIGANATTKVTIFSPLLGQDIVMGESIAVSGVCLTVSAKDAKQSTIDVEVMGESLAKTSLSELKAGSKVNLERALLASQRIGGHVVGGHVDTVAELIHKRDEPNWHVLGFDLPADFSRYVITKGSVTIDGVSLTISAVDKTSSRPWFEVSLIPTTLSATTLSDLEVGEVVNVEFDVLAKYVESMLQSRD